MHNRLISWFAESWGLTITNYIRVDIFHCSSTTAYNIWPYLPNLKCKHNMQIKYDNNGEPNSLSCFCWFVFSIKLLLLSFVHCGENNCLPLMWSGSNPSGPMLYMGWVCGWFSLLLPEVFLPVLRFCPLLKFKFKFKFNFDLEHEDTFERTTKN